MLPMRSPKILLWDLDPDHRIGQSVKALPAPAESLPESISFSYEELCGDLPAGGKTVSQVLARTTPDLIFLSIGTLPFSAALPVFQSIRGNEAQLPVLAAVPDGAYGELSDLLKQGWIDFVTLPLRPLDIFPRILRLLSHLRRQDALVAGLKEKMGLRRMIGESPRFQEEIRKIPLIAHCDAGVLVAGETGTGKEMCARAIHYLSPRSGHPFISVNCGAIPGDLIENELFGHEREAFTGASASKPGLIQEAESGTLFLDEVDSLTPLAQVKLLRFLQEKEYRPLGSTRTRKADVRIITASNLDLEKAVEEGRIRKDLYYRLDIVSIRLPPLRERKSDIPILLDHFLRKYAREYRVEVLDLTAEARKKLTLYSWPGNIRQLEHAVQRAVLMARGPRLSPADFPLPQESLPAEESFQSAKSKLINAFEKEYLQTLLILHQGNISQAAKAARKNRRAFWQLVQKHGIEVSRFRIPAGTILA